MLLQRDYQLLEKTVKRVVVRAISTPPSISARGRKAKAPPAGSAILGELIPVSAKILERRVVPRFTRVDLRRRATAIATGGRAIAAGVLPVLEGFILPDCHADLGRMEHLVGFSARRTTRSCALWSW